MFSVIETFHLDTAPPDALWLGDVSGCGEHSEALLLAIETGDWSAVAQAADDLTAREAA